MEQHNDWKIAIAGECLTSRPFAVHDEERFLGIRDLFHRSDVAYAHLEMNLGDFSTTGWPARGDWFGSYMLADGKIADDLRWLGIDIMSLANNHSLDFGAPAVLSTREHCARAGLVHAGTGRDLEEAREPAYLETRRGRVSLVSVSSGNKSDEWAGLPKGTMPGRPGVNPLRVKSRLVLDEESAERLREIGDRLGVLRVPGRRVQGTAGRGLAAGEFKLQFPGEMGSNYAPVFVEGDECHIETRCDPHDLTANLRVVEEARHMSDLVMVAHHFNVSESGRGDVPPAFVTEFARRCIDAGADVFLGHGWHKTLGIEIYKGRPIFYGLGNFFAQSEFIRRVPSDSYETWGHDADRMAAHTPASHPLHPGLEGSSETWWSSAVFTVEIKEGRLHEIRLHPVELGRDVDPEAVITRSTGRGPVRLTEGRPVLADGRNARLILERLQAVSEPYGTTVEIHDGVGVIKLPVAGEEENRDGPALAVGHLIP